jgi:hypothetical protein
LSIYINENIILAPAPGTVKCNKTHDIDAVVFDALSFLDFPPQASVTDGLTDSAVAALFFPQAIKIVKVAVYCSAIDAVTGDAFNIEVGDGTVNELAGPQDNQRVFGYPTAFAAAGNTVFAGDVAFTVANFPNLATSTGGYEIFIPTNYDTIYLPQTPLYLIVTTNASTGSISNLQVTLGVIPIDTNCAYNEGAVPGVDY